MLKTIPAALTPDLLWALAAMGHRDQLALVNANYPAHSRHQRVIALPGLSLVDAARAILQLMPLDDLAEATAHRMVPDDARGEMLPVHRELQQVLSAAEGRPVALQPLEREAFFALAATSFVAVATTDNRAYGCFLLAKGVVRAS